MSIKGGDNFDLLPEKTARDMETILGVERKRCKTCVFGLAMTVPGLRRCDLLEKTMRDDETCSEHIAR